MPVGVAMGATAHSYEGGAFGFDFLPSAEAEAP
jgi:hypothetical protein